MKKLFKEIIDKHYPQDLYIKQFSLYIDNILARIELQITAYGKEDGLPRRLFEVLKEQRDGLLALKEKYGSKVAPTDLLKANPGV